MSAGLPEPRPARLRPVGFGAAAFASFATLDRGVARRSVYAFASLKLRRTRLRPHGLRLAAPRVARKGEAWWGKKDSNLRSHKTADLQSAPFATRDTPPFNPSQAHPPKRRRGRPSMTLKPEHPMGSRSGGF